MPRTLLRIAPLARPGDVNARAGGHAYGGSGWAGTTERRNQGSRWAPLWAGCAKPVLALGTTYGVAPAELASPAMRKIIVEVAANILINY